MQVFGFGRITWIQVVFFIRLTSHQFLFVLEQCGLCKPRQSTLCDENITFVKKVFLIFLWRIYTIYFMKQKDKAIQFRLEWIFFILNCILKRKEKIFIKRITNCVEFTVNSFGNDVPGFRTISNILFWWTVTKLA